MGQWALNENGTAREDGLVQFLRRKKKTSDSQKKKEKEDE